MEPPRPVSEIVAGNTIVDRYYAIIYLQEPRLIFSKKRSLRNIALFFSLLKSQLPLLSLAQQSRRCVSKVARHRQDAHYYNLHATRFRGSSSTPRKSRCTLFHYIYDIKPPGNRGVMVS